MDLILGSLVVWRISSLMAFEEGPFGLFHFIRESVGVMNDGAEEQYETTWIAKGLVCVMCSSVWFAVFVALLFDGNWFVNWMAFSAGAIVVNRYING